MKKTLLTLAAGAGMLAVIPSCSSQNAAYPGGEEEAIMMSDATDPGVIPPWATEEDFQVPAGSTTQDRNNYAIPEGPVASGSSQHQPAAATGGGSSQHQPDAANTDTVAGNDVMVENEPFSNADSPLPPVEHHTTTSSSGGKGGGKKGGKEKRRISSAKPSMVTYKVRPGDNLTVIAKRSNTTLEQIRRDSNLKSDVIRPGQIIKVRYTPKDYKGSSDGGKKGGTASTGGTSKTVTVKKGESLSSIAAKNGVTVQQLKDHNGIKGSTIMAGQKLGIPGKASSTKKSGSSKKSSSKKKGSRRKR